VDVCKKFSKLKLHTKNKRESKYILLTLHRAENADDKDSLRILVNKLKEISNHKIIFPIHPRTKKNLKKHHIKIPKNVKTIDPVGYLEFLRLLRESKLVLTDSGGLQEEAIIFKIPCITLRYTTERWETILCGGNRLYPLLQNNQSFSVVINKMLKAKIKNQPRSFLGSADHT
jgi:UDP-N-acetylglucosamine 2-epimerase